MDDRIAAAIARLVMASDMSWQYVGAPLYFETGKAQFDFWMERG